MQNRMTDLLKIVAPPAAPLDCDERFLKRNQKVLRSNLPSDALEFAKIYGSGTFQVEGASWEVFSVLRPTYPLIVLYSARTNFMFKSSMDIDDVPFGLFPEQKGFLPFATHPNGGWVGWLTKGEPDTWKVVDLSVYEVGSYEVFDLSFTEYFCQVLTRKLILKRQQNLKPWAQASFTQDVFADQGY